MLDIDYMVATSGGNDSVALMQLMYERKLNFACVYNFTGWADDDWPARIKQVSDWCFNRGIQFYTTKPERFENRHATDFTPKEGFEELVSHMGGFPMPASDMQWCTMHLKERPTAILLQKLDPTVVEYEITGRDAQTGECAATLENMDRLTALSKKKDRSKKLVNTLKIEVLTGAELVVVTGRRREESQNRQDMAQHELNSKKHGGRDVWNPLYKHDEAMRNELIKRAGFEVLPHGSRECSPCCCENKDGLLEIKKTRISRLKSLELSLGHTSNGKPRVMFRPYRVGGGVGIESAVKWAGEYGWTANEVPAEYRIKDVDYSAFKGRMKAAEKKVFWDDIKAQCVDLGLDMKHLQSDIAYDDTTKQGVQFARQCDGGYCGS